MSINKITLQEAHGTLCFYKELQFTKSGVEIGLVLGILGTIGAVIAACYCHGTLSLPFAFKGVLTCAISFGVTTCALGVTQQIFASRLNRAKTQLEDFSTKLPTAALDKVMIQELAQYPSLILSNLMHFTSDQIDALIKENDEIPYWASALIDEIVAKQPDGTGALLQELQYFFGECESQADSSSYISALEKITNDIEALKMLAYTDCNPYSESEAHPLDYVRF